MKIGFIATGNGSALSASLRIVSTINPDFEFYGFSDRPCKAFLRMSTLCEETFLYNSSDNEQISRHANNFFSKYSCDCVYLLYSRLVTADLFDNFPVYNLHPSILPSFKGFNAVSNAFKSRSQELGVTIHNVDATIDSGDIISCVRTSPSLYTIEYWHSLAYIMKTMLLSSSLLNLSLPSFAIASNPNSKLLHFDGILPEYFSFSHSVLQSLAHEFKDIVATSSCIKHHTN